MSNPFPRLRHLSWAEIRSVIWPHTHRDANLELWMFVGFRAAIYTMPPTYVLWYAWSQLPHTMFSALAVFCVIVTAVDVALTDVVRSLRQVHEARLRAHITQLTKSLTDQWAQQTATTVDTLRTAAGRTVLPNDPISLAAASMDVMTQHQDRRHRAHQNPLRAALDGTLLPEDLIPPEDPTTDDPFA